MDKIHAEIDQDKKRIIVHCKVVDRDRIMALPGARWDKNEGICHLPVTFASCKQLRSLLGERLQIGDGLLDWATNEVNTRVQPSLLLRGTMGLSEGHKVLLQLQEIGYA